MGLTFLKPHYIAKLDYLFSVQELYFSWRIIAIEILQQEYLLTPFILGLFFIPVNLSKSALNWNPPRFYDLELELVIFYYKKNDKTRIGL